MQRAFVERIAVAGIDDGAALHDREMVGELAGEVEILLDQQDGHVAARAQIADGAADVLDDRGLDAFGRLVEQQQRGRMTSARPIASCCCWPPDRSPPRRPQHVLQHREELEHLVAECLRSSRLSGAKPVSRFSLTVSSGKISRPCGT